MTPADFNAGYKLTRISFIREINEIMLNYCTLELFDFKGGENSTIL